MKQRKRNNNGKIKTGCSSFPCHYFWTIIKVFQFHYKSPLAANNTALSAWSQFGVSWQMMRVHRRWHFGHRRQQKSLGSEEVLLGSGCRCCPRWGWVKVRSRCASLRWWWCCPPDRWPVTLSEGLSRRVRTPSLLHPWLVLARTYFIFCSVQI